MKTLYCVLAWLITVILGTVSLIFIEPLPKHIDMNEIFLILPLVAIFSIPVIVVLIVVNTHNVSKAMTKSQMIISLSLTHIICTIFHYFLMKSVMPHIDAWWEVNYLTVGLVVWALMINFFYKFSPSDLSQKINS